jgi:hypothetical protein
MLLIANTLKAFLVHNYFSKDMKNLRKHVQRFFNNSQTFIDLFLIDY